MSENVKILFVDDESNIRRSIQRGLLDQPFETIFTESGKKALKLLGENNIAVMVTDMRMPEMNGIELIENVNKKFPDVVCIILTAYDQASNLLSAVNTGSIFRYLVKPWKLEEDFIPAIQQAVQKHLSITKEKRKIKQLETYLNNIYNALQRIIGQDNQDELLMHIIENMESQLNLKPTDFFQ